MDILNTLRKVVRLTNRLRLTNKDFSLITNNCIGGVMCHDLKQRFNSPIVNLDFEDDEFIVFCQHLEYYLSLPIEPLPSDESFPVGIIHGDYGDVRIYFRHYKSFEEAITKWKERVERIRWSNLYVIMEGGFVNDAVLKDFATLPYKNKVVITAEPKNIVCSISMPKGFYTDGFFCGRILQYAGHSLRRNFEVLDYVTFINSGKIRRMRL